MPNHVINILNIDGDKDKVAKMLSEIQNDEYGIGSIDFEKIIPMPESLRIEAGSSTTRGLKAYKDFVSVYTFAGANADIDVSDFGLSGIPCIKAEIETDQYQSYLAIVPGKFLSDIYKAYSSTLLESNVRSFLKFNGGVRVSDGNRYSLLSYRSFTSSLWRLRSLQRHLRAFRFAWYISSHRQD